MKRKPKTKTTAKARAATAPAPKRGTIDFTAGTPPAWLDPVGDLVALCARNRKLGGAVLAGAPLDTALKVVNQGAAAPASEDGAMSATPPANEPTEEAGDEGRRGTGKRGPSLNCGLEEAARIIRAHKIKCSPSTIKNWNKNFRLAEARQPHAYFPEGWEPDLLQDRVRLRGWAEESRLKKEYGLRSINRYPDRVPGATVKTGSAESDKPRPIVDANAESDRRIAELTKKGL